LGSRRKSFPQELAETCDICGAPHNDDTIFGATIKANPDTLISHVYNGQNEKFTCRITLLATCPGHTGIETLRAGYLPFDMIDREGNLREIMSQLADNMRMSPRQVPSDWAA
jgi:hypothetical protein